MGAAAATSMPPTRTALGPPMAHAAWTKGVRGQSQRAIDSHAAPTGGHHHRAGSPNVVSPWTGAPSFFSVCGSRPFNRSLTRNILTFVFMGGPAVGTDSTADAPFKLAKAREV